MRGPELALIGLVVVAVFAVYSYALWYCAHLWGYDQGLTDAGAMISDVREVCASGGDL